MLKVSESEDIARDDYDRLIATPVARFLQSHHLEDQILYIVTTLGVPLRVQGTAGRTDGLGADTAAVDSELALLYQDMRAGKHSLPGGLPNPFFGKINSEFSHPQFPIYLVTRLAGYDFADVKGIIDRALVAHNEGRFVIDLRGSDDTPGDGWLREAALKLPKARVVLDESPAVLLNQTDVIGYAAWGSNDPNRKQRHLGFHWLPGAIVTEFVSTNARTFARPPDNWNLGNWGDRNTWFRGSANAHCGLYSRRSDGRLRSCGGTLPPVHAAPAVASACLLRRAESGRELLPGNPGFELDERGDWRPALFAGQAQIARPTRNLPDLATSRRKFADWLKAAPTGPRMHY